VLPQASRWAARGPASLEDHVGLHRLLDELKGVVDAGGLVEDEQIHPRFCLRAQGRASYLLSVLAPCITVRPPLKLTRALAVRVLLRWTKEKRRVLSTVQNGCQEATSEFR
jgi:hypothetical protein